MHKGSEVSVGPIKVQKYSEFIRNLVVPTNLNLVTVKPLRGTALVVFDPNLVFLVVDSMFGGDGRFHTRVEGRDFTADRATHHPGFVSVFFRVRYESWPVFEIKFDYIRSEMNTQFANIATPSEIVVAVTFTIELNSNTAEMHLCLPYAMIEPIRDVLLQHHAQRTGRLGQTLDRHSDPANCNSPRSSWWCRWDRAEVTLGDIIAMKVGDVVPIQMNERVQAMVDGVPVMNCRYGIVMAIRAQGRKFPGAARSRTGIGADHERSGRRESGHRRRLGRGHERAGGRRAVGRIRGGTNSGARVRAVRRREQRSGTPQGST